MKPCFVCGGANRLRCGHTVLSHTPHRVVSSSELILGEQIGDLMHPETTEIIEPQSILNVVSNPTVSSTVFKSTSDSSSTNGTVLPAPGNAEVIRLPVRKQQVMEPPSGELVCSFCEESISAHLLVRHLIEEVRQFKELSTVASSQAMVRVAPTEAAVPESSADPIQAQDVKDFICTRVPISKLQELKPYSFRKVRDLSFFGSTSANKRYSDFTVYVWLADGQAYSTECYGGHGGVRKQPERVAIHLVYDSLERYFVLSVKTLRRYVYSPSDSEERIIPDQICEQEELLKHLKGVLLSMDLPPRAIFKRFRKVMQQPFNIEHHQDNGMMDISSSNHSGLIEEIKTSTPTRSWEAPEWSDYCG